MIQVVIQDNSGIDCASNMISHKHLTALYASHAASANNHLIIPGRDPCGKAILLG